MHVEKIFYHPNFLRRLQRQPVEIQKRANRIEAMFRKNPMHPSIRLHPLQGHLRGAWSISVTHSVRIVFSRLESGDIVFHTIGQHDIYQSL